MATGLFTSGGLTMDKIKEVTEELLDDHVDDHVDEEIQRCFSKVPGMASFSSPSKSTFTGV